jgi:large repetitive protein
LTAPRPRGTLPRVMNRTPWLSALGFTLLLALLGGPNGCGDDDDGDPPNPPGPDTTIPRLVLNELLAVNNSTLADPADQDFDDWLEIANPETTSAGTAGFYLTDNFGNPTRFALPDTVIPAGGYLLLWLDGEPLQGPLHVPFSLNGTGGEEAAIYVLDGGNPVLIDSVSFGAQRPDTSYARLPNREGAWTFDPTPTPGADNAP